MRPLHKLFVLLALLAAGGVVGYFLNRFAETRSGPVLKSELEQRHREGGGHGAAVAEIDFALLDEARPLDLIEMDLDFPEALQALEGERVRLVGFMAPWDSLVDMGRCLIMPTYVGCNFCSPPSLTQVVFVEQLPATRGRHEFIEEPSEVSGTLRLSHPESISEGHAQGFLFVLEDAVVTPHVGADAPRRLPGHEGAGSDGDAASHARRVAEEGLPPLAFAELVREVAAMRGLERLYPIRFTAVDPDRFADLVRERLLLRYPAETLRYRAAAFTLLGFQGLEEEEPLEWLETLSGMALSQRLALVDEEGFEIHYLERARLEEPFVRLEIVKEIVDALARQHFETARAERGEDGSVEIDDDRMRALEALREGHRQIAAYRYAREQGISPASPPPEGLLPSRAAFPAAPMALELWYWLPAEAGPFFVDSRTGALGPLSLADPVFERPPLSTVEIFRPRWYDDPELWRRDAPSRDFADGLMEIAPVHTGVLGLGGIVPWLSSLYPVEAAKLFAGNWAGDRYALWETPGEGFALLLETRWQDAASAARFLEALPMHPLQRVLDDADDDRRVRLIRADDAAGLNRIAEKFPLPRAGGGD